MFMSNSKDLTAAPAFLALSCVGFLASAPAMAADDAGAGADRTADSIFVNGQYQQEPIAPKATAPLLDRSEEHTSELQSLMRISYAVFCLKKKTNTKVTINTYPECNQLRQQVYHLQS